MRSVLLAAILLCALLFSVLGQAAAGAPDLRLTTAEINWLRENGENIRYGPNPYWPPGDYMENGEHKGIVSDYIKIFEKKLGITFKRVYYDSWEPFYHGMMTGEFDLVGAAQKTEERQKVLVFTEPFLTTRLAVLTRTNHPDLKALDSLNGMTLAGIKGYSSLDYVRSTYPGAKIIPCDDDLTVLLKVSAGAADGAVVDYMMASYLIDKYSITNIKYAMELDFHWDLRFAINKKMPLLRSILDKVLKTIGEGERQKIYHKWVTLNLKRKPSFVEQHLKPILGVFSLILLGLFLVILFNRSLKKQVTLRTEELNKNAAKLQESKEYLQAVLDSTGDAIIVIDAESGKTIDVNHRMTEMFGYSRQEAQETGFDKLIEEPPFSRGETIEWLRKTRASGPQSVDWLSRHKDGHAFWSQVKICFAAIGGENRFVIVIQDITRRKQIEEQLIKAQKLEAIGVLAGGIAHDFNNILFPIVGYSEILLDDLSPDSSEHKDALEILNAGMRGRDLARQILAFSRQTEQKKVPVQIQQILKEVIKLTRSTIPANIHITLDIQGDCSLVKADPTQIHQIAMNLITNAYHAVEPESGEIAIHLREVEVESGQLPEFRLAPGRYVLLSVSDTGTGIDPDILHKIFEPYFTTKEPGKGTGLGLALVYGIVKEHQGDIRITSELGNGSRFDVYLPVMVQASETPSIEEEEALPTGTERILLVDDETVIAKLEKQMLERLGYQVTMHVKSREALKAFKGSPGSFDIVISDMTMPDMTGDRLALELTAIRPDIPIVICTGFSERPRREKAEKIGVKCFLKKPIVKAEMANMVRMVLDAAKENGKPVSCPSPFD